MSSSGAEDDGPTEEDKVSATRELLHVEPFQSSPLINPVTTRIITPSYASDQSTVRPHHPLQPACHFDPMIHTLGQQHAHTSSASHFECHRQQGWINQLSLVLFRIRQKLGRFPDPSDDIHRTEQIILLCQKIAADFVHQGITSPDHSVLAQIWGHILPSMGEHYSPQHLPLQFSDPFNNTTSDTLIDLYGIAVQRRDIHALTPSLFVALSLLRHPSGEGWTSLLDLGQLMFKQAFDAGSDIHSGKTFKVILLGLANTIVIQTHSHISLFHHHSHDKDLENMKQLCHVILPLVITTGLPFLLDIMDASSDDGQHLTLLSSKAQEAACAMVELISSTISQWTLDPVTKAPYSQQDYLFFTIDILHTLYYTLKRLLDLSRKLTLVGKHNESVNWGDGLLGSHGNSIDKRDTRVHCRVTIIDHWTNFLHMGSRDEDNDLKLILYRWCCEISSKNIHPVGDLTRDLCRIHRFPKIDNDSMKQRFIQLRTCR
jgi:hypothetical protein